MFTWDGRGNQAGKGTSSFTYDLANRLVASNTGTDMYARVAAQTQALYS